MLNSIYTFLGCNVHVEYYFICLFSTRGTHIYSHYQVHYKQSTFRRFAVLDTIISPCHIITLKKSNFQSTCIYQKKRNQC